MTKTCPRCRKHSADGHLCHACTKAAKAAVKLIAELWPHVEEAITRRDHLEPSGEIRAKMIFGPLPYRPEVQTIADEVRNDLVGWARICIEELGCRAPADTIGGVCGLLAAESRRLRKHEAASEWAGAMLADLHQISKAIDLADRRLLAGPCPEHTEDGEPCAGVVYALYPVDDRERPSAQCTKPPKVKAVCGKVWMPEEFGMLGRRIIIRQAQIDGQKERAATDEQVADFIIEPPDGVVVISVADAATIYGIPQSTIYRWADGPGHQLARYRLVSEITTGRPASVGVDSEQVARLAAQRKAELERVRDRK